MKKNKKRWLRTIALVLLVGGVYWHASRHTPTGPAEGVGVQGEITRPPPKRKTIRVATFNIHGGKGKDGRRDLDRTAECLHDLDFVALSEVRGPRLGQSQDQARRLGQKLGMAWLFAPAVRVWYYEEFGNGLLTMLPVDFWQRIPLSRNYGRSHRNAVLVALRHGDRTIHVVLTHICRRHDPERRAQLRAVISLYLSLAEPAILVGDMNSDADDPQIQQLLATPGVADPVGEILGQEAAGDRIDWIFTRGLRCVDAGILENEASDHPMVWAELQ